MASTGMLGTLYRAVKTAAVYRNAFTAYRNRLGKPSSGPVRYHLRHGVDLTVDPGPHDIRQLNEIWLDRAYALGEDFTPRPGWFVVDIGANKGLFSAWAAHHMGEGAILAVEPDERSLEFARTNLSQFPTVDVTFRHTALSARRGPVALFLSEGASGLTSVYGPKGGDELRVPGGRSISAPGLTMQELIGEGRPDLVKVDVEGSEYEILLSTGAETLRAIGRMVLEYDLRSPIDPEGTHLELEQHLASAGFAVRRVPGRRLMFATQQSARA